jgi:hypothetical protein
LSINTKINGGSDPDRKRTYIGQSLISALEQIRFSRRIYRRPSFAKASLTAPLESVIKRKIKDIVKYNYKKPTSKQEAGFFLGETHQGSMGKFLNQTNTNFINLLFKLA